MTHSIPLVVSPFYITAGYMVVTGVTCGVVTVAARSLHNKIVYGALCVLSLAGVGYQIATALYYQSSNVEQARSILLWQMDFASVGLLSTYLFIAIESVVRQHPLRLVSFVGGSALIMVIGNHLAPNSLRFESVQSLQPFSGAALAKLHYLTGIPGLGAATWYGVMAVVLICGMGVARSLWRQVNSRRAIFVLLYILMLLASLIGSALIDWGIWVGVYPIGFGLSVFVLIVSVSMALDSANRSQQLGLRERERHDEMIERRSIEAKLQRLSQVFTQEPAPIHMVNLDGNTLQVNEESIRILRRDVSSSPKVNFFDVLGELNVDRTATLTALAEGKACEFGPFYFAAGIPVDTLFFVKDSWITFKLYPIFDETRTLVEFVVRLEDVTEQKFVDNAINTISNAVSTETGQAFFMRLVVYLARLLNKKYVFIGLVQDIDGEPHIETLAAAIDGELMDNFVAKIKDSPFDVILQNGAYAVERRAQQDFSWQQILKKLNVHSYVGVAITNEQKMPVGVLMVMDVKPMEHIDKIQDVAKIFVSRAGSELSRLEAENKIRKMAFEDQLTGLPNRAQLNEYVAKLLKLSDYCGGFIQIDLDHFKTINDALGHEVGDQVIKRLGERLQQATKNAHFVARIGGDEFAIVTGRLGGEPEVEASQLAQHLLALMERPVEVGDHLLDVGSTIGMVIFPHSARSVIDVFRNADIALHKAKIGGRGGFQIFSPKMRHEVSRRISLEKGLRNAMAKGEFSLHYQPQLGGDGQLIGAEVLLRWLHPKRGYIPPALFIPVAEETGLINPIGEWVLKEALKARKKWFDEQLPFSGHLSVNVSAWQFARPDYVGSTLIAINSAEVPPSFITLEITETAVLADVKDTINKMAELRRAGITIALDDFGTGYSSLAYLRDLPLDVIKIDKAFVDVLEMQAQEPLVESMISIGKHMGLKVVAEGVQTSLQLERLKALGCNSFQGYLFAKPMSEDDFLLWLRQFDARPLPFNVPAETDG